MNNIHVQTYDKTHFTWKPTCQYSVLEQLIPKGNNDHVFSPEYGVFATFERNTGDSNFTYIDELYYKDSEDAEVTVKYIKSIMKFTIKVKIIF